jgi:CRAL/TRIO domain
MVGELTIDEQEAAARTSYAYWCWSSQFLAKQQQQASTTQHSQQRDPDALRVRMAMREARRHYVGELHNYPSALDRLRQTCQFRSEFNMDDVRTSFAACHRAPHPTGGTDAAEERRKLILTDLESQLMVIRHVGDDDDDDDDQASNNNEKSVVLLKMGRTSAFTDPDAYTLCQFYFAERAFACAEALSKGRHEELMVVFDFGSYSSAHSPPKSLVRHTVTLLQQHYPERLKRLHILDPPFWMRALYGLVSVFLSATTKEKIVLAGTGDSEQDSAVTMASRHRLASPIDLQHFLYSTPFHSVYAEPTAA